MTDQRMALFQSMVESVLTTPGDTSASLRSALVQETAHNFTSLEGIGIPSELETYVKKVALHAYRVTDQDIELLHRSGYSEDAIFEITLSVALGTGMNCLTQGLAVVQGAIEGVKHAPEED